MKRILFQLMAMFTLFSSIYSSADYIEDLDLSIKNYVYDDEGNPAFIKIYIEPSKAELLSSNRNFYQQNRLERILNKMSQKDQRGTYFVVPIKKKKSKNDDDDTSTWECPYCGTINPASNNTCSNESCPLYRKKGRDWHRN